jgi:hypothetical protein
MLPAGSIILRDIGHSRRSTGRVEEYLVGDFKIDEATLAGMKEG